MNTKRFVRQTILSEIGPEGQARLSEARVLCIGVGGLGSPASLYLAAAGVGTIGLIDPDRIETSNLQRQILFQNSDQGIEKVFAAKERLSKLNPDVKIETFNEAFSSHNAASLLSRYDLLIDGSDNFETRFLVNDACIKFEIPFVYGAVDHFEGQVALFHGVRSACYRCLFPAVPKALVRNCAETGVLGAVVGTIGTLQATLALQYLISGGDSNHPLFPKLAELTLLDLKGSWNIRSIQVSKNPKCPTCSRPAREIELQSSPQICMSVVPSIDSQTLGQLLAANESQILLLDVREQNEWAAGHIQGATHWPLSRIENGEYPAQPNSEVIIYCRSGKRSQQAAQLLAKAGTNNIRNLAGGIDAWPEKLVY